MSDGGEAAARQGVRVHSEERLVRWITPTKREEANDGCVEINLGANESLSPAGIDQEGTPEN